MKPYFIMLVGIPGSGKSRWAKAIQSESTTIVSPDQVRREMGSVSDQSLNIKAWIQAKKDVIKYLEEGKNVILDATNVNAQEWQEFIKDLPECQMVAKLFEVDPEVAYGRIEKDAAEKVDRCLVPEHAVYRYYGMYLYTKKVLMSQDVFDVTVIEDETDWISDLHESRQKFCARV